MKKFLFTTAFSLIVLCLWSQRTISGKVTDEKGAPVANASITVKGTQSGVTSNEDGSFTITVDGKGSVLVFSYVDKGTEEVAIGNRSVIDVVFQPADKAMQEVVVVAYGTVKKENFTGSATRIDGSKLVNRPLTNIASALAGAAPGVQSTAGSGQPGVTPAIRIRGFGSINADNEPLYVVDGVPYSASIANINVDDVESISLLKDASTTSLYGARAANGVVMITTKKGKKGKPVINFRATKGFTSRGIKEYDRVGPNEYYPLMWEAYRNSLAYRAANPIAMDVANQTASGLVAGQNGIKELLAYNPFNVPANQIMNTDGTLNPNAGLIYSADDLDWEGKIKRTGSRDDYNVNFGGGMEKTDYFVSLGYLKDKGFTIKTDYERYTGRINLNTQVFNWFKTGVNLAGSFIKSNIAVDPSNDPSNSSTSFVNPFFFSRNVGPIYPVYAQDATGKYILDPITGERQYDYGNLTTLGLPNRPGGAFGGRHVIAETELNENFFKRNVWSARTYGEITFLRDFKFTTNISADVTNRVETTYQNKKVGDAAPAGSLGKDVRQTTTINFNQLLNYNRVFGDHTIEALLGHENYDFKDDYTVTGRTNQIVDGIFELVNFTTTTTLSSLLDRYKVEGYFSRINYNFLGKYFASASFRRDASSRFAPDQRWGNFWSFSGAWRLDKEQFIQNMPWISQLKLRTSYGETGNDAILGSGPVYAPLYYAAQPLFALGWNNGTEPGLVRGTYADPNTAAVTNFGSLGNPDLTWETNKTFDAGLEFGLFKNRLNGSVEFFHRVSDNLLFDVPLPVSVGVLSQIRNIGSMYNRGWEINLNGDVVRLKDFTWNVSVNFTTFKNEITKLPQAEIIPVVGGVVSTKKLMVGHSIYDYWLRDWQGVDPADGALLYRANVYDAANSRVRGKDDTVTINQNNAKFAYHGSAIPDFYGSFSTSVRYKFVELSCLLTYQVGGKIYDATWAGIMSSGTYGGALSTDILRRWRKPGDITDVPRMDAGQTTAYNAVSSRWLTDATNLNIRNVTLSFNAPSSLIGFAKAQSARLYVSGENLALFSKRKGMNVEQQFTGVTSNVYNPTKIITVGVNLTF